MAMLLRRWSSRFCTEPKVLREFDTFWIAWSIEDRLTVPEKANSVDAT